MIFQPFFFLSTSLKSGERFIPCRPKISRARCPLYPSCTFHRNGISAGRTISSSSYVSLFCSFTSGRIRQFLRPSYGHCLHFFVLTLVFLPSVLLLFFSSYLRLRSVTLEHDGSGNGTTSQSISPANTLNANGRTGVPAALHMAKCLTKILQRRIMIPRIMGEEVLPPR